MESIANTGPHQLYLDTCIPSAMVKHELSSADLQALIAISNLVQKNKLLICTSTVMLDELNKIPAQYRGPHIEVYNALKIV